MPTERDTRRGGRQHRSKGSARLERGGLRLAPGVRLDGGERKGDVPVLVCPTGKVQLNGSAVAILKLCDGSRDRDAIVAELTSRSLGKTLAADIVAFLEVARSRGWVIEP